MFFYEIDEDSLLNLSISQLQKLSYGKNDFIEDFSNDIVPALIDRLIIAERFDIIKYIFSCYEDFDYHVFTEKELDKYLSVLMLHYKENELNLNILTNNYDTCIQYSLEFLIKFQKVLNFNNIYYQKSITIDYVYENKNVINLGSYFYYGYFERNNDDNIDFTTENNLKLLNELLNYKNGAFLNLDSLAGFYDDFSTIEFVEAATKAKMLPVFFNTVINDHRILSGEPCQHGRRSYLIWLKKFRRITKDINSFPTWLDLIKMEFNHHRMDQDGYLEWIWDNVLFNTEEQMADYGYQVTLEENESISEAEVDEIAGAEETVLQCETNTDEDDDDDSWWTNDDDD